MLLHAELHQQYFKRVADLNCEKLGEKPGEKLGAHKLAKISNQKIHEFKTVLMEKISIFK